MTGAEIILSKRPSPFSSLLKAFTWNQIDNDNDDDDGNEKIPKWNEIKNNN